MRLALVLPPLTQLNTPYPSTGYLAGFLRSQGRTCIQRDFGIELFLALFSREGLSRVFDHLAESEELPEPAWRFLALRARHEAAVEPVVAFLQGKDRTLSRRVLDTPFLPAGPRLERADLSAFGPLSSDDAARHLCTLYLEDLADLVTSCVDEGFAFSRYHHHLAAGPSSFDPIAERLERTTLVDELLDGLADSIDAEVVGLSVAFPGNLYGALRVGRRLKKRGITVIMGGGYVNTELRDPREPRLWDSVDHLVLDDGEGPLLALLEWLEGGADRRHRTIDRHGRHDSPQPRIPAAFAADWRGLDLGLYMDLVDTLNPAHRLWADGRWNKITVAHGCYWKRCTFCDVSLDYIGRFEASGAARLADAMAEQARNTGRSGYHLVDEAAPPKALKDLALELLARGQPATFWGNLRFEKAFTPDLCRLLAAAGMVAATGGLEVASDRLLELIDKGVTVEQVARACAAFKGAGIRVHAYLMYGFPSQTEAETRDSAELVRQLFDEGLLDSGYWHRFTLTRHAPIFQDPARFGVEVIPAAGFNDNDRLHRDLRGEDPGEWEEKLPRLLDDWMRGKRLQKPIVGTREPPDRIRRALAAPAEERGERLVWIGGDILDAGEALVLHHPAGVEEIAGPRRALDWLSELIEAARPGEAPLGVDEAWASFPGKKERFQAQWAQARRAGLLRV